MKIWGDVTNRCVIDVECDRCHKSCKKPIGTSQGEQLHNFCYATLEAKWPFGSPKDTEHHLLHLCEPCYDWLRAFLHGQGVDVRVNEYQFWSGKSSFDYEHD